MSELLNCPFCGGEAGVYEYSEKHIDRFDVLWYFHFRAVCDKCNSQTDKHNTEAEAIQAWNRREGKK